MLHTGEVNKSLIYSKKKEHQRKTILEKAEENLKVKRKHTEKEET